MTIKKLMADELRQETDAGTLAGREGIQGNSERRRDSPGKGDKMDIINQQVAKLKGE